MMKVKSTSVLIVALYGSQGLPLSETEQSGSGVGKDEVARILCQEHGFIRLKFADALRDMFYDAFGLPLDMKGNKEFELSTFGPEADHPEMQYPEMQWMDDKTVNENMIAFAEIERKKNQAVFIQRLALDIALLSQFHRRETLKFCVSDVRQFNEYCFLFSLGANFWEIQRANPSRPKQALDGQLLELLRLGNSPAIANDGSIADLGISVSAALTGPYSGHYRRSRPIEFCLATLKGWLNLPPHKSQGIVKT